MKEDDHMGSLGLEFLKASDNSMEIELKRVPINNSKSRVHGIEGAGVKLKSTGADLEPLD
ncbi:uncharacterized protein G2W53_027527 [Senna tora]|uniref:Uncharacterized protein n=1 Tax=Senna tora TaxID=362788 RepID=A0A834TH07_9FABA|nr:uncharacterized protein G2W53_027527 [Senna tora]